MLTTTDFICVHSFQHNKWQNNYTSVLKKTTYYIKSPFSPKQHSSIKLLSSVMEQRLWIKTVPWLLEKSTENLACLPCWHLAWWNFIDIRNGKKYCELHKKYVNRVKNENYSPTLKSRHKMALHRNVSSTKIRKNTASDLLNSHPKWPLKTPRNVS